MSTLSIVVTLSAVAFSIVCVVIGLALAARGRWALHDAREHSAGTLPTTITLIRDGQVYPCRWVRFVAVAPAEVGEIRKDDEIVVEPSRPARTELTVIEHGDVRTLFEVVP